MFVRRAGLRFPFSPQPARRLPHGSAPPQQPPPTRLRPRPRPRPRPPPPSYLNRGTLTYSAPTMVADPLLGLTKTDIGAMTSAFPAAYGAAAAARGRGAGAFRRIRRTCTRAAPPANGAVQTATVCRLPTCRSPART
jgi:hypothetical protein